MTTTIDLSDRAFEIELGIFQINIPILDRLRQAPNLQQARDRAVQSAVFEANRLGLEGHKIGRIVMGEGPAPMIWTRGDYQVTFYTEHDNEN